MEFPVGAIVCASLIVVLLAVCAVLWACLRMAALADRVVEQQPRQERPADELAERRERRIGGVR